MNVTRKTLGTRMFDFVVRPTFYRQFVGGDSECKFQKKFLHFYYK